MLSVGVNKFEKKAGRKIEFIRKKLLGSTRKQLDAIKLGKKEADTKALITVDTLENSKEHESEDDEGFAPKEYGMVAGCGAEVYSLITGNGTDAAAGEFALMGMTSEVQAYKNSLKTLEKQKRVYQQNQLGYEEKIRVLSIELENTTNLLKHSERINVEAEIAKKDLQTKLDNHLAKSEKWTSSSKNLDKSSRIKSNDYAFCVSSVKSSEPMTADSSSNASTSSLSTHASEANLESSEGITIQEPIIVQELPRYPQREPIWYNATRVTQSNQFVPQVVLLRSGKVSIPSARPNQVPAGRPKPVSTGRPKPVSTGKQNRPPPVHAGRRNSSSVTSCWWQSTARPMTHLPTPTSSYFQTSTPFGPHVYYNQMHYDGDGWATAVKPSVDAGYEGIVDSGCSRSMTGNKERLDDFQPFKGGKVTFGGGEGRITDDNVVDLLTKAFDGPRGILEEKANIQGISHEWSFDIDYLTDSLGYKRDKANQSAGAEPKDTSDAQSNGVLVDTAEYIFQQELARLKGQEQRATSDAERLGLGFAKDVEELQKRASAKTVPPGSIPVPTGSIPVPSGDTMVSPSDVSVPTGGVPVPSVEPRSVAQALKDPSWVDAMQAEMQQFKFQNVWIIVDLPKALYRSMIVFPNYLTAFKADIMLSVSACSKNQVTLLLVILEAVKKISKYLKPQPKRLGLMEMAKKANNCSTILPLKLSMLFAAELLRSGYLSWIQNQLLDYRSPELGPPAILATIDETPYTITEDSVRSQLQLADDGGDKWIVFIVSMEIDNLKQDRAAVVSKVIPDAAKKLVRSDDLGVLIAKLVRSSIIYGRCQAFEEVAAMQEPFVLEKMSGYRPSSKEEYDQAGDALANALYPFFVEYVINSYASLEQLLSKKPPSL
ncbi:hypothetical protein Tco_0420537 [Tanacetum coccineum]